MWLGNNNNHNNDDNDYVFPVQNLGVSLDHLLLLRMVERCKGVDDWMGFLQILFVVGSLLLHVACVINSRTGARVALGPVQIKS